MPKNSDHVVFTRYIHHSADPSEDRDDAEPVFNPSTMQYMVYGREVADSNHPKKRKRGSYEHWQGYVEYKPGKRPQDFKEEKIALFGDKSASKCKLAMRRGSRESAANYCKKDGKYTEHGTLSSTQGTRTDLADFKELIDKGATLTDCFKADFATTSRNYRAFSVYMSLQPPPVRDCPIIYLYGQPGAGKTTYARDYCLKNSISVYMKEPGQWWDGYTTQEAVIIDEYRSSCVPINELLKWASSAPTRVQTKGSTVNLHATCIILISNYPPTHWFKPGSVELEALTRRICSVRKMYKSWLSVGSTEVARKPPKFGGF